MDKKNLTEADIRTKFITPALVSPTGGKWNVMTQLREEIYFTRGSENKRRYRGLKVDNMTVSIKWHLNQKTGQSYT